MTYEQWLEVIQNLKNSNTNQDILNKLKNEPFNANLNEMLQPKLLKLFNERFEISVNKIIKELEFVFSDVNYLDLSMLNFKNEVSYLLELVAINQIPVDVQSVVISKIKKDVDSVYNILIKKADEYDYTGVSALTIKNNMIKWSE